MKRPPKGRKPLPTSAAPGLLAVAASAGAAVATCRGCGCSDERACVDGRGGRCWWVPCTGGLCSRCCATLHPIVLTQLIFGHVAALSDLRLMARNLHEQVIDGKVEHPWPVILGELTAALLHLRKRATPEEKAAAAAVFGEEVGLGV